MEPFKPNKSFKKFWMDGNFSLSVEVFKKTLKEQLNVDIKLEYERTLDCIWFTYDNEPKEIIEKLTTFATEHQITIVTKQIIEPLLESGFIFNGEPQKDHRFDDDILIHKKY